MDLRFVTDGMHALREQFVQRGFDLRLVGGVVRDTLAGLPCKDVDLCTDATPAEQVELYREHGHRWIETGLQHGTVTVVLGGVPYEVTSLRVDVDTDGRHATVEHTRDWEQDLARRDLTINAMSLSFDGELFDPFGGQADLENGVVRFVGNPADRIREDYLRILRWFRFQGRFGNVKNIDDATLIAVNENANGLQRISRERVWSEVRRIVQHPTGPRLIREMCEMRVTRHIDLPDYWSHDSCARAQEWTDAPEVLMAAGFDWQNFLVDELAKEWRWSNAERDHALWLSHNAHQRRDLRRLIAVEGASRDWVAELAALEGRDEWSRNALVHWEFPPFPVDGNDLLALGMKGKAVGNTLRSLKEAWADSGYKATKQELMRTV